MNVSVCSHTPRVQSSALYEVEMKRKLSPSFTRMRQSPFKYLWVFVSGVIGGDWLMHGIVPTFLVLIASMPHSLQLWYLRVSEVFQMTHNNWKRPRDAQIHLLIDWRRITLIWGRCFSDSGWLAFRHFRDSYSFVLMDSMEGQQLDLPWS